MIPSLSHALGSSFNPIMTTIIGQREDIFLGDEVSNTHIVVSTSFFTSLPEDLCKMKEKRMILSAATTT
jgi:hypothetical protein